MNDQQETTGSLMCDRCGRVEQVQVASQEHLSSPDDARKLASGIFTALKRYFAREGWFTSTGYDLCPVCCKAEGRTPGYHETGVAPDIQVQRREEPEQC